MIVHHMIFFSINLICFKYVYYQCVSIFVSFNKDPEELWKRHIQVKVNISLVNSWTRTGLVTRSVTER